MSFTLITMAFVASAAIAPVYPPGSIIQDRRTVVLPGRGGPAATVTIGELHSAVVFADGSCVVWGITQPLYSVTTALPGPFLRMEAGGGGQTAAILANGDAARYRDTQISVYPGPFKDIGCWSNRTVALFEDGTLAWLDGQPPAGAPASGVFLDIDVFNGHGAAAVRHDGSIVAWGTSLDDYPVPSGSFVAVAVSETHGIGLSSTGEAICWGDESKGQCDAPPGPFIAVSAWIGTSLGLRPDGSIAQWGAVSAAPPSGPFIAIEASVSGGLALRADGTLVGWGSSWSNQPPSDAFVDALIIDWSYFPGDYALRADGSLVQRATDARWLFPEADVPGAYRAIARTNITAAAIRRGAIEIVGQGFFGEDVAPEGDYTQIDGGMYHYAAIDAAGEVHCWGLNAWGQCDAPAGTFVRIAAGAYHTLALRPDGTIAAWGDNTYGQCDPPPGTYVAIAAGTAHSVALRADGTTIGWGRNHLGQASCEIAGANSSHASNDTTMIVREDGTIACFGVTWNACDADMPPASLVTRTRHVLTPGPDCDDDGTPDFLAIFEGAPDQNGDGVPDVCIVTADLDGDGAVGASDLAILLGAWGGTGPADLDGDGVVGASDLAELLGAWSA